MSPNHDKDGYTRGINLKLGILKMGIVILLVVLAVAAFVVFYLISCYNMLVTVSQAVSQAKSNIDVLLKQRHEEIPKLVEICKQYMKYEQEAFSRIIAARQAVNSAVDSGDVTQLSKAESELRANMKGLLALAENYPELKAQESFGQLTSRISYLQDSISDRREFYNERVTVNNSTILYFPHVLIARPMGFIRYELLKFEEAELTDHNLKDLFKPE